MGWGALEGGVEWWKAGRWAGKGRGRWRRHSEVASAGLARRRVAVAVVVGVFPIGNAVAVGVVAVLVAGGAALTVPAMCITDVCHMVQ